LDAKSDLQKKPNRTGGFFQNRTEPAVFIKTEPNLKNPFRTSLICNSKILQTGSVTIIKNESKTHVMPANGISNKSSTQQSLNIYSTQMVLI